VACSKSANSKKSAKSQNSVRKVAQQKAFTVKEFSQITGFKSGEYYDLKDNENCLGGDVQILSSGDGLLTLKVGDKILVTGIGPNEIVSDYSERECQISNKTKILDSKLISVLETKCTTGLNKKVTTEVSFEIDPKTRKNLINYSQRRQVPKEKLNVLRCNLVGA
jgi:hypothetical protein